MDMLRSLRKNRTAKYGVPFVGLIVIGSFGLKHFAQLRYEFTNVKKLTKEDAAKYGVVKKAPEEVTPEKIYEEVSKLDIDTWENVRGPRPWESNEQFEKVKQQKNKA